MELGLKKRQSFLIILLMIFLLLTGGCSSKEEKRDKHHKRAEVFIQKDELDKAVIELMNVIKLDPDNDIAYYKLGEVYLKLQKGTLL